MNENNEKMIKTILGVKVPARYSKYHITARNGKVYYSWDKSNDGLISDPDFSWDQFFKIPDPVNYISTYRNTGKKVKIRMANKSFREMPEREKTGYLRPVFTFIRLQVSDSDYKSILNKFGLETGNPIPFKVMPVITSYRDSLMNQMLRQAHEINRLNKKIAAVLKVYFYEFEQAAYKKTKGQKSDADKEKVKRFHWERVIAIKRLFSALVGGNTSDQINKGWIPQSIQSNPFISEHLINATLRGISTISKEKEPFLEAAGKIGKEINVLESVIEDAYMNDNVSSDEEFQVKADAKPHPDIIDLRFKKLAKKIKVEPAFWQLKEEMLKEGLDPEEYGLSDEPNHYNRAVNKRIGKKNRNAGSSK